MIGLLVIQLSEIILLIRKLDSRFLLPSLVITCMIADSSTRLNLSYLSQRGSTYQLYSEHIPQDLRLSCNLVASGGGQPTR